MYFIISSKVESYCVTFCSKKQVRLPAFVFFNEKLLREVILFINDLEDPLDLS